MNVWLVILLHSAVEHLLFLSGTGDPPVTRAGTGLGKISFLMDGFYVRRHGFGLAKSSGFVPVAIPNPQFPIPAPAPKFQSGKSRPVHVLVGSPWD